jgi:hypothetical protein
MKFAFRKSVILREMVFDKQNRARPEEAQTY